MARVYSVPSAHPELNWTPLGGYPYLGYLIRFGTWTIYHAGGCQWYEGIAGTAAAIQCDRRAAADRRRGELRYRGRRRKLAEDIRARWLIPMHCTFADASSHFVDHMLGFQPSVGFKVFEPGERWMIP